MNLKDKIVKILEDKDLYKGNYIANVTSNIRKELKAKGYTTKQVSVRQHSSRYDYVVDVTIKDVVNVNPDDVHAIVKKYEKFDRDERTGEILQGGNTFISVEYDYSELEREYSGIMKKLVEKLVSLKGRFLELKPGFKVALVDGQAGGWNEKFAISEKGNPAHFIKRNELMVKLAQMKIKEKDIK